VARRTGQVMKLPNGKNAYVSPVKLKRRRTMMKELDAVVLTRDIKEYGLTQGDIGAVAHCYADDSAYEVEFVTAEGRTLAVLTVTDKDIRPMKGREIPRKIKGHSS